MASRDTASLTEHFGSLVDPRIDRTKRHNLMNIVTIALCGVIAGADSWVDVEAFGRRKAEWLRKMLDLPNGIPSHDTFGRVFAMLDAQQFERCFTEWVLAVREVLQGDVVAIDGKSVRRSHDRYIGKDAIHMVSAWASASGVALGQTRVDERSNEITAIPRLLEMLQVEGCIVTIDAMGCQKEVASKILDEKADYVLAVKKNQGRLHEDVHDIFDLARKSGFDSLDHDYHETINASHGRIETRRCWAVSDLDHIRYVDDGGQWPGLTTLVMVEGERLVGGKTTVESRYYISSLPNDASVLLNAVRSHWSIENQLHWSLDVTFNEDGSRVRSGNGAENFSVLRRMALNLLKAETSTKRSLAGKRKDAAWDNDYLLKVLDQ